MDANKCFALIRGRAIRVTRVDACGVPVPGPQNSVVSEGFITVGFSAQVDEGTTISVVNAAGKQCILDEPCPTFTGYNIEIALCGVNPILQHLMTNQPVQRNAQGDATGFRVNSKTDACGAGFALEVWTGTPAEACGDNTGVMYGYMLVPFVKGGVVGDFTIANDAINFTLSGAKSKDGNGWGVGPYEVFLDETDAPSPLLEPADADDHLIVDITPVAPPEPSCDPIAVGTPATGASAGMPGTYTPANSYGPKDFASIGALVADPTTAWTTGQHIVLLDGSTAHWDGTDWTAGPAA